MPTNGEALPKYAEPGLKGQAMDRGFTAAFELVATPALFGVIGYFIDRQFGTGPIFTVALAGFVACYGIWRLWYDYNAEMDRLDVERRSQPLQHASATQMTESPGDPVDESNEDGA